MIEIQNVTKVYGKQTVLSCLIPYGPLIWLLLRQRTLLMKMQKIQLRLRKIILR